MTDCAGNFGYPNSKFERYVLNCEDYKNCEDLYHLGIGLYEVEGCKYNGPIHFHYQTQKKQWCSNLDTYTKIAKQKMENYKK